MKHITYICLSLICFLVAVSCDENFDEINTNSVDPTAIDQVFILNSAIIGSSYSNGPLIYEMGIVQQIITPNSGVLTGANYNQDNRNATENMWNDYFVTVIRDTRDLISQVEGEPERANLVNMARILQTFAFMVLTDTYGDIPFNEGGKGFTEQVSFPAYDAQQNIYPSLIQELTQATQALNDAAPTEPGEVLYGGDISKWRKLGYSLLLRAGMRLSKVDPGLAQQTVQAAVQGGVLESNEDNFVIRHDNNYTNAHGSTLNGTEANNFFLAEPFVDFLKETNDPRLSSIAITYVGALSGPEQTQDRASSNPAVQVGMPMGNDNNSVVGVAESLGLTSFYEFAQVDRTRIAKVSGPMFILTHAQTQLLLAEAAVRGWVSGAAADYFEEGVRAHMEQMALHDEGSAIPEADIDAYLATNSFDEANALEQINTQYWVASFFNGPEAFANFRRSGFPDLDPNPFPGQDISGDFIRRLTYPSQEIAVNSDNLNAAISRQGPDVLDTRVWWDVP